MKYTDQKSVTVIGMVHFSPLEGDPKFSNKEVVLERAKDDLVKLIEGGVGAVMFENNFDNPKFEKLPSKQANHLEELIGDLAKNLKLPWGVSPLWNDYGLGFRLCKKYGGSVVRVPVFVDSVRTAYGEFYADPKKVLESRLKQGANTVKIFADVHVKHSEMLVPRSLEDSIKDAIHHRADAVIVTGTWTGDPPSVEQVIKAREIMDSETQLFIGSGMNSENIKSFLPFIDGCIVGSAFKEDAETVSDSTNIFSEEVGYDLEKIKDFISKVK